MPARGHLIFDADDTLWENNRIFEEVIADFIEWLAHPELDAVGVRRVLDDVARANVAAHGYGTKIFIRSLEDGYRSLAPREVRPADLDAISELVRRLTWEELEIIDGVPETLATLAARHDLLLLTKGDDAEQRRKLAVSGLASHFRAAVVVREKDADAYASVVADHGLDPAATWMIGNSPKSDILPALEAGLRAVFVPHEHTWRLEHAELPATVPGGRLLTLTRFRELLDHF
jgi:putative hydrolase of the HAD superfamily